MIYKTIKIYYKQNNNINTKMNVLISICDIKIVQKIKMNKYVK